MGESSPSVSRSESSIVDLTEAALEKLKTFLAPGAPGGVRLGVLGGGCAGLQYQMDPCDERKPEDIVQEIDGVRFFLHPMVIPYLKGIRIDYSNALVDGGFKFINPNAASTCGCGTSFGV